MCCNKNRAPRAFGNQRGCGQRRGCGGRPTLARMLVEHIVAKREEKKALAAGSSSFQPMGRQTVQQPVAYRDVKDVKESGWVDEKEKLRLNERGNVSRATLGAELPSYREAMKGV